jgi:hypothetical protein
VTAALGPSDAPLEIAVLAGDEYLWEWERNALAALGPEPDIEVTQVVVDERERDPGPLCREFVRGALEQVRAYPLWSLVGVVRLLTPAPDYERRVHVDSVAPLSDAERVASNPGPVDGSWNRLPDEVVDRVADTDVAVRFGFGLLAGRVLDAPRYGVLGYHPGDIREYRGQPGGFWEVLDGADEMGVTVQRLTERLDGGEIAALETFEIEDTDTWQDLRAEAFRTAEDMLVPAIRTLVRADETVERPDRIGELNSVPEGRDVVRYLVENTRRRIRGLPLRN